MELITLDKAYRTHVFVKDRTKGKGSAVKRPVRVTENEGSLLKDVLMPEKFHQFRVFTVFRMVYLDKADQAI